MAQKSVLLNFAILAASAVLMAHGLSISSVMVSQSDSVPASALKSIGTISIPKVPEFPMLATRPGKPISIPGTASQHQNVAHQPQQQPQSPPAQYQTQHQPVVTAPQQQYAAAPSYQPNVQQNTIPSYNLPGGYSNVPVIQQQPEYHEPVSVPVHFQQVAVAEVPEAEHDYSEYATSEAGEEEGYHHDSHAVQVETTIQNLDQEQPVVTQITTVDESNSGKNQEQQQQMPPTPEKIQQEASNEFSMPPHVVQILNALGGGGSLAQASKPEKEGDEAGYTTANAIGYATGDNATVTASVSNKMEFNTQTVILTESASASASSMSNGTAFSQATLASNGYNPYGGNGWKSNNKIQNKPV